MELIVRKIVMFIYRRLFTGKAIMNKIFWLNIHWHDNSVSVVSPQSMLLLSSCTYIFVWFYVHLRLGSAFPKIHFYPQFFSSNAYFIRSVIVKYVTAFSIRR